MKRLTFNDLTIDLKNLLAEISVIKSSYSWNNYCEIISGITKQNVYSELDTIHTSILAYIHQLKQFTKNPNYRNDTNCVDKFLSGEILVVRKMAINALSFLQKKADNTIDDTEKELLQEVIYSLRTATNDYLNIVREIIQNNQKLQEISLRLGIDYIQKYQLENV